MEALLFREFDTGPLRANLMEAPLQGVRPRLFESWRVLRKLLFREFDTSSLKVRVLWKFLFGESVTISLKDGESNGSSSLGSLILAFWGMESYRSSSFRSLILALWEWESYGSLSLGSLTLALWEIESLTEAHSSGSRILALGVRCSTLSKCSIISFMDFALLFILLLEKVLMLDGFKVSWLSGSWFQGLMTLRPYGFR